MAHCSTWDLKPQLNSPPYYIVLIASSPPAVITTPSYTAARHLTTLLKCMEWKKLPYNKVFNTDKASWFIRSDFIQQQASNKL